MQITGGIVSLMDPRTIVMLTGMLAGMLAIVLLVMRRSYAPSIQGLGEWASAVLLFFVTGPLFAIGDASTEVIRTCVANTVLMSGIYLCYVGTQRFFGVTPKLKQGWSLIAVVVVVLAWFTVVDYSYAVRLAITSALQIYLFSRHAWLVYQHGIHTFPRVMLVCVLGSAVILQVIRYGAKLANPQMVGILDNTPVQVFYVTTYPFIMLLFTISTIFLATERMREELEHLATHDSLTDAFTRRQMNKALTQELERSRRHRHDLALLAMDLDHFKAINDTHGHQEGDKVLVEFVTGIRQILRSQDLLGRFGGEEFVVMLPETSANAALAIAEQIRCMAEQGAKCTVSIGVTSRRKHSDTVDILLTRADTAMYRAKANGRNRVEFG